MTPRLPPLQAQCTALEPSWNTVGGTYSINSTDSRPLEAAALVGEDNLTQSHHHHLFNKQSAHTSYFIFKVDIGSMFQKLLHDFSVSLQTGKVQCSPFQLQSFDVSGSRKGIGFIVTQGEHTSSWTFGFPLWARNLSISFKLPWLAAFMNSAVSSGWICPHKHTRRHSGTVEGQIIYVHVEHIKTESCSSPQEFSRPSCICTPPWHSLLRSDPKLTLGGLRRSSLFPLPGKWQKQWW